MATSQKSGSEFEKKIADELKKANFTKLNKNDWRNRKAQHSRCFTTKLVSGCGLYGGKRYVDFRVRDGCIEFDLEAKYKKGSGTSRCYPMGSAGIGR